MDSQTIVFDILAEYYGRMYGKDLCQAMAEHIVSRIEDGTFLTRGDIMHYVWMNTSDGGVAEMSSTDIQAALPQLKDTHYRSSNGKVTA